MTDTSTLEVQFTDQELERLRAAADDPSALLREAAMNRVRLEESIDATFSKRDERGPHMGGPGDGLTPPPIASLLGFEVTELGDGEATIVLETGREHASPLGTLHGGVICDIGDAAMGVAYATTVGRDESFTTLELGVNYLRPVWEDRLTAVGRVVNRGRTVGLVECDVHNAEDQLVARLSSTCMTLRGEAAAGR